MIPSELINYKIISLGSGVATDKAKIITYAYTKATVGFDKDQHFNFYSIITFDKKDGEPTQEVSVTSGSFNKNEWGRWVNIFAVR